MKGFVGKNYSTSLPRRKVKRNTPRVLSSAMTSPEPQPERPPGLRALWGVHLRRSPIPSRLAFAVVFLTLAGLVWPLATGEPRSLVQTVLAGLTLLAGVAHLVATQKARARIQGELRETARSLETSTY